jgi:hypothetical protein
MEPSLVAYTRPSTQAAVGQGVNGQPARTALDTRRAHGSQSTCSIVPAPTTTANTHRPGPHVGHLNSEGRRARRCGPQRAVVPNTHTCQTPAGPVAARDTAPGAQRLAFAFLTGDSAICRRRRRALALPDAATRCWGCPSPASRALTRWSPNTRPSTRRGRRLARRARTCHGHEDHASDSVTCVPKQAGAWSSPPSSAQHPHPTTPIPPGLEMPAPGDLVGRTGRRSGRCRTGGPAMERRLRHLRPYALSRTPHQTKRTTLTCCRQRVRRDVAGVAWAAPPAHHDPPRYSRNRTACCCSGTAPASHSAAIRVLTKLSPAHADDPTGRRGNCGFPADDAATRWPPCRTASRALTRVVANIRPSTRRVAGATRGCVAARHRASTTCHGHEEPRVGPWDGSLEAGWRAVLNARSFPTPILAKPQSAAIPAERSTQQTTQLHIGHLGGARWLFSGVAANWIPTPSRLLHRCNHRTVRRGRGAGSCRSPGSERGDCARCSLPVTDDCAATRGVPRGRSRPTRRARTRPGSTWR